MISSLASVFVANAKATPENVVPCAFVSYCLSFTVALDLQNRFLRSVALYFSLQLPPLRPGAHHRTDPKSVVAHCVFRWAAHILLHRLVAAGYLPGLDDLPDMHLY
jgi:hypothetical protein